MNILNHKSEQHSQESLWQSMVIDYRFDFPGIGHIRCNRS
jgi:hypothetical protein